MRSKIVILVFTGCMVIVISFIQLSCSKVESVKTTALWPFDEQQGLYPSCVLSDLSDNDYPLVLGPGAMIVEGKFGNALDPVEQPPIILEESKDDIKSGLARLPVPEGRTQPPLSWFNADFAALMTSGEKHLRNQVGFARATETKLNLGAFDWTVEFWLMPTRKTSEDGVIFEIGSGPRGENERVTSLSLNEAQDCFIFANQPAGTIVDIPTELISGQWQHMVFTHQLGTQQLKHYVNGKLLGVINDIKVKQLESGEEDYMSVGRDALWNKPLQGKLDELRFSTGVVYNDDFDVPGSFSCLYQEGLAENRLLKGPPLLFAETNTLQTVHIADRKHLFIDDALIDEQKNIEFRVNPPRPAEIVMTNIPGTFRKHLCVVEDDEGKIRLYTTVEKDYLALWISDDGIHFTAPDLPDGEFRNHHNIVLHAPVGMGIVFRDPNAPPAEQWKYISDYNRRAVCLFYSKDGLSFKRYKQPVLPFRSGSQCNIYYDDQKQVYTAFHRSDFGRTMAGETQRDFVMTETKDLLTPWPFESLSQEEAKSRASKKRTAKRIPWYLDNGPLTPGGFSVEYPWIFSPDDALDPVETDIYVPKALKYPWAPDTYLAFPILYFHYENAPPVTRFELMNPSRERGSGPLETQVAVSRDGMHWKRYPRPAYVGIGDHGGIDLKTSYIAHGMIKRNQEIWQYNFGEPHYHSPWVKYDDKRVVYRLVQRLDGFISLDSPYEKEAFFITKPLVFKGNRLLLNIDTDAAGYAQVGFLDETGNPVSGFAVDDCIYINGDFIGTEVEWMQNRQDIERLYKQHGDDIVAFAGEVHTTSDLKPLEGKTVRMVFRMRGSKLYSMKFESRD